WPAASSAPLSPSAPSLAWAVRLPARSARLPARSARLPARSARPPARSATDERDTVMGRRAVAESFGPDEFMMGVPGYGGGRVRGGRSGWRRGQGVQGLAGEVAGGDGFEQVVHGGGEGPFGGCFALAA